jgi:hypothetical protein
MERCVLLPGVQVQSHLCQARLQNHMFWFQLPLSDNHNAAAIVSSANGGLSSRMQRYRMQLLSQGCNQFGIAGKALSLSQFPSYEREGGSIFSAQQQCHSHEESVGTTLLVSSKDLELPNCSPRMCHESSNYQRQSFNAETMASLAERRSSHNSASTAWNIESRGISWKQGLNSTVSDNPLKISCRSLSDVKVPLPNSSGEAGLHTSCRSLSTAIVHSVDIGDNVLSDEVINGDESSLASLSIVKLEAEEAVPSTKRLFNPPPPLPSRKKWSTSGVSASQTNSGSGTVWWQLSERTMEDLPLPPDFMRKCEVSLCRMLRSLSMYGDTQLSTGRLPCECSYVRF